MSSIRYFVHQSMDGFIEGPQAEFDWPVMGPELSEFSHAISDTADAFLYGRKVWEMMSGFWPNAEEISDDPHDVTYAPIWREKAKIVVSTTLEAADWNTTVVADPADLPALGQDLILFGGSALAGSLTAHGLIDEYLICVHPVVLGGGKPVFPDPGVRIGFDLAESRVLDGRVVLLRYRRR